MKQNLLLTITSLLSILFMTFHLTDDIVRGFEKGGVSNLTAVPTFVVWICGALVLAGRRIGAKVTALFMKPSGKGYCCVVLVTPFAAIHNPPRREICSDRPLKNSTLSPRVFSQNAENGGHPSSFNGPISHCFEVNPLPDRQ